MCILLYLFAGTLEPLRYYVIQCSYFFIIVEFFKDSFLIFSLIIVLALWFMSIRQIFHPNCMFSYYNNVFVISLWSTCLYYFMWLFFLWLNSWFVVFFLCSIIKHSLLIWKSLCWRDSHRHLITHTSNFSITCSTKSWSFKLFMIWTNQL